MKQKSKALEKVEKKPRGSGRPKQGFEKNREDNKEKRQKQGFSKNRKKPNDSVKGKASGRIEKNPK